MHVVQTVEMLVLIRDIFLHHPPFDRSSVTEAVAAAAATALDAVPATPTPEEVPLVETPAADAATTSAEDAPGGSPEKVDKSADVPVADVVKGEETKEATAEEGATKDGAADGVGSASPTSRKRPASDDEKGGDEETEEKKEKERESDSDDSGDDDDEDARPRRGGGAASSAAERSDKRRRQDSGAADGDAGPKAPAVKKEKVPIEREKVCPLLLRVFPRSFSHYNPADFANGRTPRDELNMHTWMDCTFKELSRLVGADHSSARRRGTKFEFANVVNQGGRTYVRQFAAVTNGRESADDVRELRDTKFQIGDMLSVAIFPKGSAGDPGGYAGGGGRIGASSWRGNSTFGRDEGRDRGGERDGGRGGGEGRG